MNQNPAPVGLPPVEPFESDVWVIQAGQFFNRSIAATKAAELRKYPLFSRLFGKARSHEVPQQLYGTVVAQARLPVFFTDYGFPDTVTGRFDLLALHLFLFSRRLVRESSDISVSLNQEVFDYFTADVDRALRELGVGDTSVPKRKKKMIKTFYALVEELGPVLDGTGDEAVLEQITRRFNTDGYTPENRAALARYVRAAAEQGDGIAMEDILKGSFSFPDPQPFLQA